MSETKVLLPVWDIIGFSWKKVHGSKATFWAAIGILILVGIAFAIINAIVKNLPYVNAGVAWIQIFINYLLEAGVMYIGIQRAFDLPITYRQMFRSFEEPYLWRLIFTYLLMFVMMVPFFILTFIGIILMSKSVISGSVCIAIGIIGIFVVAIRLFLNAGFVLDKNKGAWEAIKASYQATRGNFWRIISLGIIEMVILMISIIPLCIPLIWVLPFMFIIYGEVYKILLPNVDEVDIQHARS